MRRSKTEIYLDILEALTFCGPLKLNHIMYKAKVNGNVLKRHLNLLITENLVEERTVGEKRVVYSITQKGRAVFKRFLDMKQMLPIPLESPLRMQAFKNEIEEIHMYRGVYHSKKDKG